MATVTVTPGNAGGAEAIKKRIAELKKKQAAVGWFAGMNYPDGTPVAYVAACNEFGVPTKNIPARSFQRSTMEQNKERYAETLKKGVKAALSGKRTVDQVYEMIGMMVAGDMRTMIARGNFQELALRTKKARAYRRRVKLENVNTDPLRDTNVMVTTLNHAVEDR